MQIKLFENTIERFKDSSSFVRSRAMKLFSYSVAAFGHTLFNVNLEEQETYLNRVDAKAEWDKAKDNFKASFDKLKILED